LMAVLYLCHAKFPGRTVAKRLKAPWTLKNYLSHPFVASLGVTGPSQRLDDTYK
jgi:hypothetical protein